MKLKIMMFVAGLALSMLALGAEPQIEIVVPFPPGGGQDILARSMQQVLLEKTKYNVIVLNKTGGDGAVAFQYYETNPSNKILMVSSGSTVFKKLISSPNYDPVNDLDYVASIGVQASIVMVPYDSKYQTIQDLLNDSKVHNVNCGASNSAGVFFLKYLAAKEKAPINIVPYKGSVAVTTAVMGKQIDCAVDAMAGYLLDGGAKRVRLLAVASTDFAKISNLKPIMDNELFEYFYGAAMSEKMDPEMRKTVIDVIANLKHDPEFVEKHKNIIALGYPSKFPTDYKKILIKTYQDLLAFKDKYNIGFE